MNYTSQVSFFRDGFFGYSSEVDFHMGTIWHFLPIAIMIIVIILIYKYREQLRNYKYEGRIRYILAFVMIMVEMSYFWRLLYVGSQGKYPDMMSYLPIQMCQWGLIICCFTIMSKNQRLFNINYYITILFASIALIYPIVITYTGPTYYRYYQFWLEHTLPIIGVFYLMFVNEMRPTFKGILDTLILLVPLTIVCSIANHIIPDANYLYLKLEVPLLPPGQIYRIPILAVLSFSLFAMMYFIYYCINKKTIKKEKKNNKNKSVLFMDNKDVIKEYAISKSSAIMIIIQMILLVGCLLFTIYGIYTSYQTNYNINRIIIYFAQVIACICFIVFGYFFFKKKDNRYLKAIIISYILLDAIKISLLQNNINELAAFEIRFAMVLSILAAALLFEKMNHKEGIIISLIMVGLELLLYGIFIIADPETKTRVLFMYMPLVGGILAGTISLFVSGRLEQLEYTKTYNKQNKKD